MKKKLVVLLAALMVLASTTTALAAPSISAGDLSSKAGSVTKVEAMTDAEAKEAAKDLVIKAEDITVKAGNVTIDKAEVVSADVFKAAAKKAIEAVKKAFDVDVTKEVKKGETKVTAAIVSVVDVTVTGTVNADNKATLTFKVADVKAGETILVLHQLKDGTWETITPDNVADGVVTATFTSFSPVAFVKVAATAQKDGDVFVLPMLAVAGLVGTAVCGKKIKFN